MYLLQENLFLLRVSEVPISRPNDIQTGLKPLRRAYIKKWKKLHLLCDHDEIWILCVKILTEPPETIKSRHFQVFLKILTYLGNLSNFFYFYHSILTNRSHTVFIFRKSFAY